MAFEIKKAERTKVKLKLAIEGPSGSGKTYSALLIAAGLVPGGRVLVVDTENSSASLFSNLFEFYTVDFEPPYTPERYREVINMAVAQKFDVLIIDSGSHEWSGKGGCLEIHDNMPGNSWTNWARVTPRHDAFVAAMLQAPIHTIMTLRSKEKYIQEEVNGKQKIKKMGAEAVQRDGLSYEFSVVLTMDISHQATSTKDRTGLFPVDQWFVPTKETGRQIAEWLESGTDAPVKVKRQAPAPQETPQPKAEVKDTSPEGKDPKKAIYGGYLRVCGNPEHAKNAILLVTAGRASQDWTEEDMINLELDLKMRKERANQEVGWQYEGPEPESVRDVDPGIDEEFAADMGIGPDPEPEQKPEPKPFSEIEKLRAKAEELFGQGGLEYTVAEREEWIKKYFKVEGLKALKKEELKKVIALAEKEIEKRTAAEMGGAA
jgi:hypothetical protein